MHSSTYDSYMYMYPCVPVSVDDTVTGDIHKLSMDTHLHVHVHVHVYPHLPHVPVSVHGTVTGDVHGLSMDTHLYPHIHVHVPSCPSIRGWHTYPRVTIVHVL